MNFLKETKGYFASLVLMVSAIVLTIAFLGLVWAVVLWIGLGVVSWLLNRHFIFQPSDAVMLVLLGPIGLATTISEIVD